MAPGLAWASKASSTTKPSNASRLAFVSSSWPIEVQTSVYTTSAPSTASRGSAVVLKVPPRAPAPRSWMALTRSGSKP